MTNTFVERLVERCIEGCGVDAADALGLVRLPLEDLLRSAYGIREARKGRTVSLCAIINAKSGMCGEDCVFCAQSRRWNTNVRSYPLLPADGIARAAESARRSGATRFGIVTSGVCVNADEVGMIGDAVYSIGASGTIKPCASLGSLSVEHARLLRAKGLTRYHHNLESSPAFFPRICSTHSWESRRETLVRIKGEGYTLCCGALFGMGESWHDRIELGLAVRALGAASVPVNFLSPVKGTPLGTRPLLAPDEALRIIALFRFLLPDREIRVAGGREMVLGDAQERIFHAGADGLMIGDYLTMRGRPVEDDLRMIERLGYELAECPS
jgi:biotin synthase